MKRSVFFLLFSLAAWASFAETTNVLVEVSGVAMGRGDVYLAVYDGAEAYKKEKYLDGRILNAAAETIQVLFELPTGDYVFSVFQDTNGNGKLDKKAFGIPKEAIGISNYEGKGFPGGFDKLKVTIAGRQQKVRIHLVSL